MAYNAGQSSGNLLLISTQTASSSASINFTTIPSFDRYVIVFDNVSPGTNNETLTLTMSTNNGGAWLNSNYVAGSNQWSYNSAVWSNTNTTTRFFASPALSSGAGDTAAGEINIYDITSGASAKINGIVSSRYTGVSVQTLLVGYQTATSINAFQMIMTSGNIATGKFSLYGVQN